VEAVVVTLLRFSFSLCSSRRRRREREALNKQVKLLTTAATAALFTYFSRPMDMQSH
jgi:hypothetical protein